jgi:hypothetical protein
VYHDREAELKARVDRDRVKIGFANASEPHVARALLAEFKAQLARAKQPVAEAGLAIDTECEPVPASEES